MCFTVVFYGMLYGFITLASPIRVNWCYVGGFPIPYTISGKTIRCQCTCPETMSREGSPVRGEGSSAGRGEGSSAGRGDGSSAGRGEESSAGRGERSSASESGEQLAQLLEEVRRLREGQEDAALKMERGARRDPYIFKRRGNENQYRFSEELADRVTTASSSVARAERGGGIAAFDRAKEVLREGMDLISRRQLIKFADRSEAGWAVVDEYVDDDLADDSEDEKRMERAERMAERKMAKKRKAATQETGGMKRGFSVRGLARQEVPTPRAPQLLPTPQFLPTPRAPFQPANESGVPSFGGALGGCFQCGQFGHIKRNCPQKTLVTASQYPFHESEDGLMGSKAVDYEGILTPDSEDVHVQ